MNVRHLPRFAACLALAACVTNPGTQAPSRTQRVAVFKVDGNGVIVAPVSDAGALPLEGQNYVVVDAGPGVTPGEKNGVGAQFGWHFAMRAKYDEAPLSVRVELVDANGKPDALLRDDSPSLKDGTWSGQSAMVPLNRVSAPWLYNGTDEFLVFKFSMCMRDARNEVIYQPSLISARNKTMYLNAIAAGRN